MEINTHDIDKFIETTLKSYTYNLSSFIYNDLSSTSTEMINTENIVCDKLEELTDSNKLLVECKNKIYNCATNFITSTFFPDKSQEIYKFQYLINNLFNNTIQNIIKYINTNGGNLKNTDIIFLYKGGTTLKILYETYRTYFTETENNYFYSQFSDSFARTDSDYVIMINPNITVETHGIDFEIVYRIVNYHVTNCLYAINIFIYNSNILNRTLITKDKLDDFILNISKIINEFNTTDIKCPKYKEMRNIIGIGFIGKQDDIIKPYVYQKDPENQQINEPLNVDDIKSNIILITKIGEENLICGLNDGILRRFDNFTDINLSINDMITITNREEIISSFCLQRLKINFVIYYAHEEQIKHQICRGELIDVVILKKDTQSLHHFYDIIDNPIKEYTVYQYYNLFYNSYTIDGHINDLLDILFNTSQYPWDDKKYEKRINRLIFLLILKLYNNIVTSENELEKNKNSGFLRMLIIIFNYINSTFLSVLSKGLTQDDMILVLDKCIYKIDEFITLYPEFIFMHKFKELFQKVKNNLTPDLFQILYQMIAIFVSKLSSLNLSISIMMQSRQSDVVHVTQLGGKYKEKYLKYKQKYLELKRNISIE
jgi:hypothetical protein